MCNCPQSSRVDQDSFFRPNTEKSAAMWYIMMRCCHSLMYVHLGLFDLARRNPFVVFVVRRIVRFNIVPQIMWRSKEIVQSISSPELFFASLTFESLRSVLFQPSSMESFSRFSHVGSVRELHIRNLRLHERELCPSEEVDQTTSPWSEYSFPNGRMSEIYSVRLQQFGVVLWWNMPVTSTHGPTMGNGSNWVFHIAEQPAEFVCRIYAGHTIAQMLVEIQKMPAKENVHPFQFKERITFASMHNDIDCCLNRFQEKCKENPRVASYARYFEPGWTDIPLSRCC